MSNATKLDELKFAEESVGVPIKERITSPKGGEREALGERWDLIPYEALREVAKVFHKGDVKYTAENWKLNSFTDSETTPLNHALGHLNEAAALPYRGEERRLALAQAATNILMQLWDEVLIRETQTEEFVDHDPELPPLNILERLKNKVVSLTSGDE